ncbi:bacillithiol biosynthesis cysteine-adding enzyme BshC [Rummeliibacillus pycnus]|uniref:bacillithiol biosynthesis cysteine-adding enzyme BshC n=1 Tax=Rummeliibacillus pycnus TaxID=101070 RepID=UPI000C9B7EE5|nr:bacillithiol biosynthesis cysteine-adding enzyme BshC [Rummeliibacillus pycnus]
MKLAQIEIPVTNPLLDDYRNQKSSILSFFHYPNRSESFSKRLEDLQNHPIRRERLVAIIRDFMEPLEISDKAEKHLQELEDNAVVIVGGQQSGLLTGPLYSVHKAISVILLAKEQRENLGIPVVPVFWIAGEDHDIDEINHTFTAVNGRLVKHIYGERSKSKKMASTTRLDVEMTRELINETFKQYGETVYTEKLLTNIDSILQKSTTYTDFFVQLMNWLFKEEGLLFIDAANPKLREYEAPYFEQLIQHSETIANVVTIREADLAELGYGTPIGATKEAANLFYVRDGERFLLERHDGKFINHMANVQFSKSEMLTLAKENPTCLSNNVVTRPLMQDMVFPVLAFVGGPGELAYWSTLKDAFETLNMKVPVFVPRMNITIVDRQVQSILDELQISVADALAGKTTVLKTSYEEKVYDTDAKKVIEKTKQLLQSQYEGLQEHLRNHNIHLEKLVDKNLSFHEAQLDFIMRKIEQEILLKHDVELRKYRIIEDRILPGGGLQERTFNPFQFMNEYGEDLVKEILSLPFAINGKHNAIFL